MGVDGTSNVGDSEKQFMIQAAKKVLVKYLFLISVLGLSLNQKGFLSL